VKARRATEAAEIRISRVRPIARIIAVYTAILFQHEISDFLQLCRSSSRKCEFRHLIGRCTGAADDTGAFAGGLTASSRPWLIVLSRSVWVNVLGHAHAVFPYDTPTLFRTGGLLVAVRRIATDRSVRGQASGSMSNPVQLSERGPGAGRMRFEADAAQYGPATCDDPRDVGEAAAWRSTS